MNNQFQQFSFQPIVINGSGSRELIIEKINQLGGKNVVIFTDQGLNAAGVTVKIQSLLEETDSIHLVGIFDVIEQDARGIHINEGVQFIKEREADTIIALGGGSVIDTAKIVKWMLHKNYEDINLVLQKGIREDFSQAQPITFPLIAFPTTAGTGAEISPVAVSFNDIKNLKVFIRNPYITPNIAILDADLTVGLPPNITAFTGFDAFTHAVEAFFAKGANPISDAFAIQALQLIIKYLPRSVVNGTDLAAREKMLIASMMGMTAFVNGATENPVHNVAHVFGAKFRIPHGLANAVILPIMMKIMPEFYLPRIQEFAEILGIAKNEYDSKFLLSEVINFIKSLQYSLNLPSTFSDFNIVEKDLINIIDDIHNDPSGERYYLPDVVALKVAYEISGLSVKSN